MIFNPVISVAQEAGGQDVVSEYVEDISFTSVGSSSFSFDVTTTYSIKSLLGLTVSGFMTSVGGTANIPVVGGIINPITVGDNYDTTSQRFACLIKTATGKSNGTCTVSGNKITLGVTMLNSDVSAAYPQTLSGMDASVTYIPA